MVQHHSQLHSRQPSLFAGGWRHLLPRADDPAHLLSLKVKALSACLAGERALLHLLLGAWAPAPPRPA